MKPDPAGPNTRRLSRGRIALFSGFVVVLLGVLTPLLMEGVVRLVRPQTKSWLDIHAVHPGGLPFHHNRLSFRDSVDIGEARFEVVTDERGHRVASRRQSAPSDAKNIWFVGDSFTFGQGSSFEDSFAGRVAAAGFRVDNCGVNAWGPAQYLEDFEYNLRSQRPPDAVVLATYLGNDYFDMVWSKALVVNDGVLGDTGDLKSTLKRSSHLYRLIANVYHAHFPGPRRYQHLIDRMADARQWNAPELRRAEELYRQTLREFQARCRDLGIPLLVLVIPLRESVAAAKGAATADPALDYGLVTRRTLEFLRNSGIEHGDLTPALAELGVERSFLAFDGHLKPEANALAGRAVLEWLARRL